MATFRRHPARTRRTRKLDRRHYDEKEKSSSYSPSSKGVPSAKSSLDITQKFEKKLAELNASDNIFKRWMYEIATCGISVLCLGLIVFVLFKMSGKALSEHKVETTAYTVLSKVTSAALLLPISEALGQLKWSWFNGDRSKEIWDFEIFDKASRGAWGSVLLLFRTKERSLAALGAILTLLIIANDSFFQQVVDFPQRWALQSSGQISRTITYAPPHVLTFRDNLELAQQDTFALDVVIRYLYFNGTFPVVVGDGVKPDIPISCPTSNCTFPTYKTLGVCSQCEDVGELLDFGCKNTTADWIQNITRGSDVRGEMCGYFLNITHENPLLMSGYLTNNISSPGGQAEAGETLLLRFLPMVATPERKPLWDGSIKFKNIRNAITDVITVASADGAPGVRRNQTPVATECVLYWCVQEMESSYAYGSYQEKVIRTFRNSTPGPFPWTTEKVYGRFNGTMLNYNENVSIQVPGEDHVFGMSNSSHDRVTAIFDDFFPSFLTLTKTPPEPVLRYISYATGAPYTRRIPMSPWLPPNNLTRYFERMSTAMTNAMRTTSPDEINGAAYSIDTFIRIQWEWLIFPLSLMLLSLIFLIATMVKTSKFTTTTGPGIWKTSTLPALMYSLPSDTKKRFNDTGIEGKTLENTKKLRVKLHPEKGWRVSGQVYSPTTPVIVYRSNQPPPGWI